MSSTANGEVDAALRFHAATKYSPARLPSGELDFVMGTAPDFEPPTWEEDWSILPSAFKTYTRLPPLALPADLVRTHMPALEAIAASGRDADPNAPMPDRTTLAQVAYLSNGLLHRRHVGPLTKRVVEFRTAGAPGGYYHLELYFVCSDLTDLPGVVYHYATQDHALRQIGANEVQLQVVIAAGCARGAKL